MESKSIENGVERFANPCGPRATMRLVITKKTQKESV